MSSDFLALIKLIQTQLAFLPPCGPRPESCRIDPFRFWPDGVKDDLKFEQGFSLVRFSFAYVSSVH